MSKGKGNGGNIRTARWGRTAYTDGLMASSLPVLPVPRLIQHKRDGGAHSRAEIEALVHGADRSSTLLRRPARIELVKQVQRWLDAHPDQPITLADLCQVAYVSRRSLIQGFRDHLGMGPMQYLKLQRLHSARRALLRSDPREATVTAVAAEFGFLNAGHFARDYQNLFGERPSVTLRQSGPRP